jgi:hypothetical protein
VREQVGEVALRELGTDVGAVPGFLEQVRFDLRPHLVRAEFLEEAGEEVAGVVDEHIDPAEAFERRPHGCFRRRDACDVELDDQ